MCLLNTNLWESNSSQGWQIVNLDILGDRSRPRIEWVLRVACIQVRLSLENTTQVYFSQVASKARRWLRNGGGKPSIAGYRGGKNVTVKFKLHLTRIALHTFVEWEFLILNLGGWAANSSGAIDNARTGPSLLQWPALSKGVLLNSVMTLSDRGSRVLQR